MWDSAFKNIGNLDNAIKGLPEFDDGKPGDLRDWHEKLAAVLDVVRRDTANEGHPGQPKKHSGDCSRLRGEGIPDRYVRG